MSTTNGDAGEFSITEIEESSTLDHALLESLFYNEMMMLSSSSPTSSTFLSQHFNEATHPRQHTSAPPTSDPTAIAEKELLQDFGVSSAPTSHEMPGSTLPHVPPPVESWQAGLPPRTAYNTPIAPAPSAATAIAPHPHSSQPVPIYPAPSTVPPNVHQTTASAVPSHTAAVAAPAAVAPLRSSRTPTLTVETAATAVPQDRAKQLVDQFATLASRLGIELPTNVLQSLTTAAAQNDPKLRPATTSGGPAVATSSVPTSVGLQTHPTHPLQQGVSRVSTIQSLETEALAVAPTVEELRRTAEEAIASVTKRRALDSSPTADSFSAGLNNAAKDAGKHNKRRKKPRLADCESRLAELKAENALLKRHLHHVSNKAHRFDKEKDEAGKRIHGLLEEDAGPDEMIKAVGEFSEMYSDYGRNRQQELSFHLEQLQRLVNPTNFTKMGLWTLGQNTTNPKQNPIAGILQEELDINSQQGRRILDQSEKIKALCENLKECLSLLAKLNSLCEQKTQIFHDRMSKCREILTSKQVVKLIKWIDDHTLLLETVCPGWGTEHIHSLTKH